MPLYIEIAQSNGGQVVTASSSSNGTTSVVLADSSLLPSSGKVVFKDSNGNLQKLTFTANNTSTNKLTIDASTWLATGNLEHPAKLYEDSYHPAMENIAITERVITD
tara:strand:- start:62 stop:382 length:321 start_codon:yes stop_codon:yes gene_type:complete